MKRAIINRHRYNLSLDSSFIISLIPLALCGLLGIVDYNYEILSRFAASRCNNISELIYVAVRIRT